MDRLHLSPQARAALDAAEPRAIVSAPRPAGVLRAARLLARAVGLIAAAVVLLLTFGAEEGRREGIVR